MGCGASSSSARLATTSLELPKPQGEVSHVYHQYVVRSGERDRLQTRLKEQGIGPLIHYPVPVHLQPAYRIRAPISLPETERAAREVLSLPMFPQLTIEQIERVCQAIINN